ncbi:MAG: hypothetical protein QNL90_08160 [Gammaproteobacteria bacterium]|nr:hypothetical protein [Gammaproteobacteria bacterium]
MNSSLLLIAVLFGSVGLGYFVYGRKQNAIVPLLCGVVLMVFPYFVTNAILMIVVGLFFSVLPYFLKI